MTKTTDALIQLIATRSKDVQTVRALLGDGTGTVAVANTDNYVWARPYGRDMPVRAYGAAFRSSAHDLPVKLEVLALGARIIYRVAGIDDLMYIGTPIPASWASNVPAHAPQHQISSAGHDVVYFDSEQLLPLLMFATDPASTSVYIAPGAWWGGSTLRYWEGGASGDLSAYAVGGMARYVLIYFDAAGDLGYVASATFPDIPASFPSPYDVLVPLPANSTPLGMVLVRGDGSNIDQSRVFAFRDIISMVMPASTMSDTLMLAARSNGLYKGVGSGWVEIEAADTYLESIEHIAIADSNTWLMFREQTAAATANPLVYKTPDGGATWAKAQTGITYTQSSHIWKVCAIWQSPTDSSNIAIVIANTSADTNPQIFVTFDAGDNWTEVDNTGLPTTVLASDTWPVSLAVEIAEAGTFRACLAMSVGGMYYVNLPTTWVKKAAVTETVHAVINNWQADDYWWAVIESKIIHTTNSWTGFTSHLLNSDKPSPNTHTIFQHLTSFQHLVVGEWLVGVYSTTDGSNFDQSDAQKVGPAGAVLTGCIGDPNKLFVTDTSGNLNSSLDAGLSYQRLSVTSVQAFAALSLSADVPGVTADFSALEMWLKV